MSTIKQVLMKRDGLSPEEADELINEAQAELFELLEDGDIDAAYDICSTHFGLEPDYLDELML